ncbi:MAG: 6-hydroxymethylpterin diphosphokinase MptE-like protein [Desulfovibrio sp.]
MKIFSCRYGALPRSEWNGETVVALGEVDIDPAIPVGNVVAIPKLEFVNPAKLCARLPEAIWESELLFVLPPEPGADNGSRVLQIQKQMLTRAYSAYFHRRPVQQIDPALATLMGALKDPTRSLSQLRNYPWLLRYPLADKLAGLGRGKPALILMAGPSLTAILPRLPELAERCVVICIARTLGQCLAAGVEPDFVVQYDTNMEQRQFYDKLPHLERTALVSLSSAHIHPVAGLFRGVFLRGSFGLPFLPNPFTLRDGVEGSLTACLGLAEVLGSSHVYVIGADLSWPRHSRVYAGLPENRGAFADMEDVRMDTRNGLNVRLGRRDGRTVHSSVNFVAGALKAGEAAAEISASTGALFYTLSEETLLPEKEFPLATLEEVLEHAPLDRASLLEGLDRALNQREALNFRLLWGFLHENERYLAAYCDIFTLKLADPQSRKTIMDDPVVRILENMRGACWISGINDPLSSAKRLLAAWRTAYADAGKFVLAHILSSKGTPLTLLCHEDEEAGLRAALDRLIPGCELTVRHSAGLGHGADGTERFDDRHLSGFLRDEDLVLASPRVMERHAYFWELAPDEKVIDLRKLGDGAW